MMFLLVVVGFLVGCGQKGPLYREAPASENAVVEQTSSDDHDSNKQAEEH